MQALRVSLVQPALADREPAANRATLERLTAPLAGTTDLVVLPEMFATGFTMNPERDAEPADGDSLAWMRAQARHLGAVVTGSLAIREGTHYFNRLYWVGPDGGVRHYDKRHGFRMAGEHEHYSPGRERLIVELGDWRVCPLVCYDLRFPVFSRNRGDYDLLIYVANWPAVRRTSWQRLLPARAIENLAPVIGVNRVGADGNGRHYAGESVALDWLGEPLADAGRDEEAVTSATLDPERLQRFRRRFPALDDADRFILDDTPPG
ncbi:Omega-amidase YafV [wastewater metagenome]|uniref:Omega-amidase YafV n=2 Tax=unclassified sequences TaxID=12908 RepID=A0A5B8R5S0_9ZZZZ|nr:MULTISPECIES: amidohydrolase [Arhodomonas]MCS4504042.1 amidohydrolase [Arhodomonas aquaeolei]QEA04219.1 omega-amidase YafV [uncultured organism]